MKVAVLQEVDVVQVVVDDEDVDENNDKDDSDNDIDEDDEDIGIDVQESFQIDVVELGIDEDKGSKQRKDDGQMQQRNPHCKDDRFEENATEVLDAHVVVRKTMAQFGQVDVGKDGDTIDDDDLVDVARHVLIEDEDKGLCAVELSSDMMQVQDAQIQIQ